MIVNSLTLAGLEWEIRSFWLVVAILIMESRFESHAFDMPGDREYQEGSWW